MVFVKVRETYDLHTVKNKMTVIGIHTPKPDIIKKNFPGLLMQCRAYRPVSADVRVACASMLPLDPLGVGTADGDVAPEDVFNPILYKAMSNKGMSQLEARINFMKADSGITIDVDGNSAAVEVSEFTNNADDFGLYYGLLSNAHDWKHANAQSGLSMSGLKPLVYELVYNVGDVAFAENVNGYHEPQFGSPDKAGNKANVFAQAVLGNAKPFPFLNCTSYSHDNQVVNSSSVAGFPETANCGNAEVDVPYLHCYVGCILVPPSRLHQLFYRMVIEWTLEFTAIRPISEITTWGGVSTIGSATHYMNYSYSSTKEAITGSSESILDSDACMVSANVDVDKVM